MELWQLHYWLCRVKFNSRHFGNFASSIIGCLISHLSEVEKKVQNLTWLSCCKISYKTFFRFFHLTFFDTTLLWKSRSGIVNPDAYWGWKFAILFFQLCISKQIWYLIRRQLLSIIMITLFIIAGWISPSAASVCNPTEIWTWGFQVRIPKVLIAIPNFYKTNYCFG